MLYYYKAFFRLDNNTYLEVPIYFYFMNRVLRRKLSVNFISIKYKSVGHPQFIYFIKMMAIFSNFTFLIILKLIFILFLIILNSYLIYLEIQLFNSKATVPHWRQAGILDANLAKTLKGFIYASGSLAAFYSATAEYRQDNAARLKAASDLVSLEITVKELETNVYNSEILNEDLKSKMSSVALSIKEEISQTKAFQARSEGLSGQIALKLKELEAENAANNVGIKENILKEIAALKKDQTYLEGSLNTSVCNTAKYATELSGYNETKESFFGLNIFEYIESFGPMEKVAISLLLLNQIVISAVISIIYIFYGEYLIKRFNLENRYPKLAKLIELRRKFQSYYLLLSIGWIVVAVLIETWFCILVLTP